MSRDALFTRLLSLHGSPQPKEDFFTEIVARLLQNHPRIARDWLIMLEVLDSQDAGLTSIRSQGEVPSLGHHPRGSRPDLQIGFTQGSHRGLVFIESKLGSKEQPGQLKRYAEILGARKTVNLRHLVYVTRDYDPKDSESITAACQESVAFHSSRWYEFYRVLQSHMSNALVREAVEFMEALRMDNTGQWEPSDLISLQQLPSALSLMQESMWGKVHERFQSVVGNVKNRTSTRTQMERHNRYIMYTWMRERWWCGLGYFFSPDEPYPSAGIILEVAPNSPQRTPILKAMREIKEREGWTGTSLEKDGVYSSVRSTKPLRHFIATEDHVYAVKGYFLDLLGELEGLRVEFPKLPWIPSEDEEEENQ